MNRPLIIVQPRLPLRDPHDCTDANDELAIYEAVFDTLIRREGTGFVSRLAESWTVSEDAKDWVFKLRAGVRFHDGSPCDAASVCLSLLRMARADKGYTLGSPGVWRQYLGGAHVAAPDDRTVSISLATPMADLLDVLVQGYVAGPASLGDLDAGITDRPIGTGPYRVMHADNAALELARVPDHFSGTPAHQHIQIRLVPDAGQRLSMLQEAAADVATSLDYHASQSLSAPRFTRVETTVPVAIIYLLNAAKGPLADARLRRALNLALDRQDLIDTVVGGAARPLLGFVSPMHFGAGDGAALPQDLTAAKALLADAGYADGLTLSLDCPTRLPDEAEQLTAALGAQLAKIGITLDIKLHSDREAYAHMVRRKEIGDLCVFDSSPLSTFRVLHEKIDARVRGAWWQGYHNADVETLIDVARTTPNEITRAALFQEAYAEMQRDPPWLTLYNPIRVTGLRGDHPGFDLPVDGVLNIAGLPGMEDA
ncbi:ABC transporter substrate-binding protein [Rhodophyticola sp.]|jgi:peptide/nickel transport system substrate-binding protein|uniref:ABC transporter substrate-binding protein n=1 Tax=Rhodophyticola sp. TaxID=2680032 RepID=UPI003D2CAB69